MSRKHNTTHPDRGSSNYPARLAKRGLSKAPRMEPVETLRTRQERRELDTGSPYWTPRSDTGNDPSAERLLLAIFTDGDTAA